MRTWPALSLLLFGCGRPLNPSVMDVARLRAATDLHCPTDRIATYLAAGSKVVARGCGAWTEYTCFYSHANPICPREQPPAVFSDEGSSSE